MRLCNLASFVSLRLCSSEIATVTFLAIISPFSNSVTYIKQPAGKKQELYQSFYPAFALSVKIIELDNLCLFRRAVENLLFHTVFTDQKVDRPVPLYRNAR